MFLLPASGGRLGTAINSSGLKHLALYGACGGMLIVAMRYVEYRFLVVSHSVEIYAALIAAVFAAIGIWLGLTITGRKTVIKEVFVPVEVPGVPEVPALRRRH